MACNYIVQKKVCACVRERLHAQVHKFDDTIISAQIAQKVVTKMSQNLTKNAWSML